MLKVKLLIAALIVATGGFFVLLGCGVCLLIEVFNQPELMAWGLTDQYWALYAFCWAVGFTLVIYGGRWYSRYSLKLDAEARKIESFKAPVVNHVF